MSKKSKKKIAVSIACAAFLIGAAYLLPINRPFAFGADAICGNDIVEAGEQCDGTADCTTGCVLKIPSPVCGNDIVEAGEQCDGTADCTTGCKIIVTPPVCTSNCGGGGGGGGTVQYAKIEVSPITPVPKTQAGTVVTAKVAVKNVGNISAEKVELAAELPKEFEYSVGQIIAGTSTVVSGYNTNITLSGNEHYGRLWNLGDIKEGNNLNISIPVKVKSGASNGIYKIKVFARANNEISSNKEVRAEMLVEVIGAVARKPKPPVTPIVVKPSPKPAPKPKLIAVVATSTPKVCISADEYAALVASSTRLAKELENKNKLGLLAAVGDVFDLGTGNVSFGLLVLFLLILALIIAARLVFHYLDYKDGKNGAEESKNQLPLIQD